MILGDVTATIGNTPLVQLRRLGAGLPGKVAVKLESRNPGGSVKDRIAAAMVDQAQRSGRLKPGATLVEGTSGNTGIALAMIAAARGYRLILTMPERMSAERVALLRMLGAQVELTPGSLMKDAEARAEEMARTIPGALRLRQFDNPANPDAHRKTTAEEIWRDTDGRIDAFVAGVGTGGTITGVGSVLKVRRPTLHVVAVEPERAAVLSGKPARGHAIQGIGAGFVPSILDRSLLDEVMTVTEEQAFSTARRLSVEEGILAGISSGAAVWAALSLAARERFRDGTIVTMVCDSGERYLSTALAQHGAG